MMFHAGCVLSEVDLTQGQAYALPSAGDVIAGKYRIDRVLGQGGMGVVFAAYHTLLDQRVALKILSKAEGPVHIMRFMNEARAAARIESDNVARVMDIGALANGLPYI